MLDKLFDTTLTLGLAIGAQHLVVTMLGCSDYSTVIAVAVILVARYAAGRSLWKRISSSSRDARKDDEDGGQ